MSSIYLTSPPRASSRKLSVQDTLASITISPSSSKAPKIGTSNPGQLFSECIFTRKPFSRASTCTYTTYIHNLQQIKRQIKYAWFDNHNNNNNKINVIKITAGHELIEWWLECGPVALTSSLSLSTFCFSACIYFDASTIIEVSLCCKLCKRNTIN